MKKYQIVLLVILIIIGVGATYWLFNPTGLIATERSERYLIKQDSILSELDCRERCRYIGPSKFPLTRNPHLSCQCSSVLNREETIEEMARIGEILEGKGWSRSQLNDLNPTRIVYFKDDLRISARSADNGISISLEHITLYEYDN